MRYITYKLQNRSKMAKKKKSEIPTNLRLFRDQDEFFSEHSDINKAEFIRLSIDDRIKQFQKRGVART